MQFGDILVCSCDIFTVCAWVSDLILSIHFCDGIKKEHKDMWTTFLSFFFPLLPLSLCTQIITTKVIIACRLGSLGSCRVREKSRHLLFLMQIGFFGEIQKSSSSMQIWFFWSERNYPDISFHADWVLLEWEKLSRHLLLPCRLGSCEKLSRDQIPCRLGLSGVR